MSLSDGSAARDLDPEPGFSANAAGSVCVTLVVKLGAGELTSCLHICSFLSNNNHYLLFFATIDCLTIDLFKTVVGLKTTGDNNKCQTVLFDLALSPALTFSISWLTSSFISATSNPLQAASHLSSLPPSPRPFSSLPLSLPLWPSRSICYLPAGSVLRCTAAGLAWIQAG